MDLRAVKCVSLGYSSTKKGYKCYYAPTKKHDVTMDVTFVENQSYFNRTYLQGDNISRLENWVDWHVKGIETEKKYIVAGSVHADKGDRNKVVANLNPTDNPSNLFYNQLDNVSTNFLLKIL